MPRDQKTAENGRALLHAWADTRPNTGDHYSAYGYAREFYRTLTEQDGEAPALSFFFAEVVGPVAQELATAGRGKEALRLIDNLASLDSCAGAFLGETPEGVAALKEIEAAIHSYIGLEPAPK